jgi:hypothetical protein
MASRRDSRRASNSQRPDMTWSMSSVHAFANEASVNAFAPS